MVAAILGGLAVLLGSLLARVLVGSALALVIYTGVSGFIDSFVLEIENQVSLLDSKSLMVMIRAGFGTVLDVWISTIIGVATVSIAGNVAGVRKS